MHFVLLKVFINGETPKLYTRYMNFHLHISLHTFVTNLQKSWLLSDSTYKSSKKTLYNITY